MNNSRNMTGKLFSKLLLIILLLWVSWSNVAKSETLQSTSQNPFLSSQKNITIRNLRKKCISTNGKDSITLCKKLVEVTPSDPESWNNLGYQYYRLQKYREALVAYKQALDLDPTYSLAWANICGVLSQFESYDLALEACDRALQNDSFWGTDGKALAWDNKGNVLFNLGRYQQSLDAFNRALAANPDYHNANINRVIVLSHLKHSQGQKNQTTK